MSAKIGAPRFFAEPFPFISKCYSYPYPDLLSSAIRPLRALNKVWDCNARTGLQIAATASLVGSQILISNQFGILPLEKLISQTSLSSSGRSLGSIFFAFDRVLTSMEQLVRTPPSCLDMTRICVEFSTLRDLLLAEIHGSRVLVVPSGGQAHHFLTETNG